MGKATKRERQKANRALKNEETERAQSRAKTIRAAKALALVLVIPAIIAVSIIVNKATDPDVFTAKITVAIDGVKELPNNGVIEVEFDNAHSPKSVKHFVAYASNGEYDGLSWHRVVQDFVIQGGDPLGDDPERRGSGDLGEKVVAELPSKGYKQGDLAWAKGEGEPAGTAGSQFFVVTGKTSGDGVKALNQKAAQPDGSEKYQYGYIGHVTKGLDAALKIEALAPADTVGAAGGDAPTSKTKIIKIEVYKNGKLIKRGDLIAPTTTTTVATTPVPEITASTTAP